jgi:hypothetical protein
MTARGATVYRALPSRKWPGEANLEVAHVWFRNGQWDGPFLLDDAAVDGITSQLRPPGRVVGKPFRLSENAAKAFKGIDIGGIGFLVAPEEAQRLLDKDPRNRDVLFPYLNGEDLNSRWDQSPSRWVINFHDWPLERAMCYPDCFEIVDRLVRPERLENNEKVARMFWWRFFRPRPEMCATIAGLERVLIVSQTGRRWSVGRIPTGIVYSHSTVVFNLSTWAEFAAMQAVFHEEWRLMYGPTLRLDARYTPTDCFGTFPFPLSLDTLESIGERYDSRRREIMAARREGLTTTYNRFHSQHEVSTDIATLRALQVEMDNAVSAAYGWTDLDLRHGFHQTKQGIRYTISEAARGIVLDRLLALNHERFAAEQSAAAAAPRPKAKPRKRTPAQPDLF